MASQVPTGGVKARLAKYQEELNRKKEQFQNREIRQVAKLEQEKTDVVQFSSPTKTNRKAVMIDTGSIGRLNTSMNFDLLNNNSASDLMSPSSNNNSLGASFQRSFNFRTRQKQQQQQQQEQQQQERAANALSQVLDKHSSTEVAAAPAPAAGDSSSLSSSPSLQSPTSSSKQQQRRPFGNLRARYLQAIGRLRPNRCVNNNKQDQQQESSSPNTKQQKREHFKKEFVQKRDEYHEIRSAWDAFEESTAIVAASAAAAAPSSSTADNDNDELLEQQQEEDKQLAEQIQTTEAAIATEFTEYANEVVAELSDNDDDDDDDLLKFVQQARQMRAEQERRRQLKEKMQRKLQAAAEKERLMREDRELLEQAQWLMEQQQKKKKNGTADADTDDPILELCSDEDDDDDDDDSLNGEDSDEYSSSSDEDERQKWLQEARRLKQERMDEKKRQAGGTNPDLAHDSDSSENDQQEQEGMIDQAKRLRRAYIRERARKNAAGENDSDSDGDEDVDDLAHWLEQARLLREARKGKNLDAHQQQQHPERRSHDDSSDSSDDDDEARKQVWLIEARRLRQEALEKKMANAASQGIGGDKVIQDEDSEDDIAVVNTAQKIRRAYVRRRAEDSDASEDDSADDQDLSKWIEKARKLREAQRQKNKKQSAAVSDSDSSDDEDAEQRAAWLAEARTLREQRLAEKKTEAEKQGKNTASVVDTENSDDDEAVVKEAKTMRRAHIKRRFEDSEVSADSSNDEDLSNWIAKARQAKELRSNKLNKKGSSSDSDSSDDEIAIDPAQRALWLQKARQIKAKALAQRSADMGPRKNDPEAVAEQAVDKVAEEELVNTALKLERKYHRKCSKNGKKVVSKPPESFLEEARRLKAAALEKKEAERLADLMKPQKLTGTVTSSMEHSSESGSGGDNGRKQAWLEEARRLREHALEKKRAKAASQGMDGGMDVGMDVQDDGSEEDVAVVNTAQKMRRAYVRRRAEDSDASEDDSADDQDLSTWIKKARKLTEAQRQKNKKQSAAVSDSDSSDDEDAEQRAAWLAEARKLREQRLAEKKTEAEKQGKNTASVVDTENSDDDEAVVKEAKTMRHAHIKRRFEDSEVSADSSNDEDLSNWIAKARKDREARSSQSKRDKEFGSDSESSDDEDAAQRAVWMAEARRLREERVAQKRAETEAQGKDANNVVNEECSDDDAAIAKEATKMRRAHIRQRAEDSSVSADSGDEDDLRIWIEKARKAREARGAKSKKIKEKKKKRYDSDSDSSENEIVIDPAEKAAWLEQARQFKAKTLARPKGQIESRGESRGAVLGTEEAKEEEEGLVMKAIKLERKYQRQALKKGGKTAPKPRESFLEEARHYKAEALARKEAERRAELFKKQKITSIVATSIEAPIVHSAGLDDNLKRNWLEEARRLKEEAVAQKKASAATHDVQTTKVSDSESEDEEEVVQKAIKLHRKKSCGDSDNDASKWISQAREQLIEEKKQRKGKGKAKKHMVSQENSDTTKDDAVKKPRKMGIAYGADSDTDSDVERAVSITGEQKKKKKGKKLRKKNAQSASGDDDDSGSDEMMKLKPKAKRGPYGADSDTGSGEEASEDEVQVVSDALGKQGKTKESSKEPKRGVGAANAENSASPLVRKKDKNKKEKSKNSTKKKTTAREDSDGSDEHIKHKSNKKQSKGNSYNLDDVTSDDESYEEKSTVDLEKTATKSGGKKKSKSEKSKKKQHTEKSKANLEVSDSSDDEAFKRKGSKKKSDRYDSDSDAEESGEEEDDAEIERSASSSRSKKEKKRKHNLKKHVKKESTTNRAGKSDDEVFNRKSKPKQKGNGADSDSESDQGVDRKEERTTTKSKTKKSKTKKKKSKKKKAGGDKVETEDSDENDSSYASYSCSSSESDETKADIAQDLNLLASPRRKKKQVNLGKAPEAVQLAEEGTAADRAWKSPLQGWLNMPPKRVKQTGHSLTMNIPRRTDMWRKTRTNFNVDNAPFHWMKVTGDFEIACKISGDMYHEYDRAFIAIRENESTWVMTGMEYFDGRMNHTTCVTLGSTDRSLAALPPNAGKAGIWFSMKRVGDAFECFYSFEQRVWVQTRQGQLTATPTLYVGICGASPGGEGFKASWEYFRCRTF